MLLHLQKEIIAICGCEESISSQLKQLEVLLLDLRLILSENGVIFLLVLLYELSVKVVLFEVDTTIKNVFEIGKREKDLGLMGEMVFLSLRTHPSPRRGSLGELDSSLGPVGTDILDSFV